MSPPLLGADGKAAPKKGVIESPPRVSAKEVLQYVDTIKGRVTSLTLQTMCDQITVWIFGSLEFASKQMQASATVRYELALARKEIALLKSEVLADEEAEVIRLFEAAIANAMTKMQAQGKPQ